MPLYQPLLPTRKLGRIVFTKFLSSSKTRTPSCLQNSLDNRARRKPAWTHWLLFLVLIPSFFYTYTYYFLASNTAVDVRSIQRTLELANKTTGELDTEGANVLIITKARPTTDIPPPTVNVEDIIPHGKYKKGFQPLVKSPYIEAYHSLGGYTVNENTNASSANTNTTLNSLNKAMTCTLGHNVNNAVKVNKTVIPLERVDKLYPNVKRGGHYVPSCQARHQLAILVPYSRNRKDNLAVFLLNIHPYLMRQNVEYRIFVLEQDTTSNKVFNKGRLFNAGFIEAMKIGKWKCIIFHDVDLLPLDHRILYTCPETPRHMCATVQEVNDKSYKNLFGGVSALTPEQYMKANGYSNLFWSWGGEDHDMFWRLKKVGLSVVRYSKDIARFTMLSHSPTPRNPNRYRLLSTSTQRQSVEGLSTVDYKVLNMTLLHLYTNFLLDINPYKEIINQ